MVQQVDCSCAPLLGVIVAGVVLLGLMLGAIVAGVAVVVFVGATVTAESEMHVSNSKVVAL